MAMSPITARGPLGPAHSIDALIDLLRGDPEQAANLLVDLRDAKINADEALAKLAEAQREHDARIAAHSARMQADDADAQARKEAITRVEEQQRDRDERQRLRAEELLSEKDRALKEFGEIAGALTTRETAVEEREKACVGIQSQIDQGRIDLGKERAALQAEREEFEAEREELVKQRQEAAAYLARTSVG